MEANLDVILDRLRQGASEEVSLVRGWWGEGVRDGRWCRGMVWGWLCYCLLHRHWNSIWRKLSECWIPSKKGELYWLTFVSTIHQLPSSLLTQVLFLPLSHGVRGAEVSLPHDAGAGHVRLSPLQMFPCQSTTIQGSRFSIQLCCSNNVSGFSVGCCINREQLSATNLSSENIFPTFWLNADDNWSIQSKRWQVIFWAQVGNRYPSSLLIMSVLLPLTILYF